MKILGANVQNGIRYCNKCNSNLSDRSNSRILAKFDNRESYGSLVLCKRCQSIIQFEYRRKWQDIKLWDKGALA